jgi:hypothetical protein
MAFGHSDTDTIYDQYIKPFVTKCGFIPKRVDRILHNDYVDRKIIQEIDNAVVCIADLTYARQSVYFEAGYAQHKIPVLYTCRKDHFKNIDDSLKVHFDLRQKNIIPWKNSKDRNFLSEFKKRFQHISKPLLKDLSQKEMIEKDKERFRKLSSYNRQKQTKIILNEILKDEKYREILYKPTFYYAYSDIHPAYLSTYSFYYKKLGTILIILHDVLQETFSKKDVDRAIGICVQHSEYVSLLKREVLRNVKEIRSIIFLISQNRFNKNNLQQFVTVHQNPSYNYYISDYLISDPHGENKYSIREEICVFDKITSPQLLKVDLRSLFEKIQIVKDRMRVKPSFFISTDIH